MGCQGTRLPTRRQPDSRRSPLLAGAFSLCACRAQPRRRHGRAAGPPFSSKLEEWSWLWTHGWVGLTGAQWDRGIRALPPVGKWVSHVAWTGPYIQILQCQQQPRAAPRSRIRPSPSRRDAAGASRDRAVCRSRVSSRAREPLTRRPSRATAYCYCVRRLGEGDGDGLLRATDGRATDFAVQFGVATIGIGISARVCSHGKLPRVRSRPQCHWGEHFSRKG